MRESHLPLTAFAITPFALAFLTACHPPAGNPESRAASHATAEAPAKTPPARAPEPSVSGSAEAAPASPVAAAAAPKEPPCPASYTCDYSVWNDAAKPAITEIFVQKGPHRLYLVADKTIVRTYTVALGWGGGGPKKYEGDGVTPTGTYTITDRLDSKWHTFLGVSYPNLQDQREFPYRRARGEVPAGKGIGFGIALHGHAKSMADGEHKKSDWTLGCIALDNGEIDEVAAVVKKGTRIVITD